MNKKVFMLGGGGHAGILVDILKQNKCIISGIFTPDIDSNKCVFFGIPIFENEDKIFDSCNEIISLVNGVGSLPGSTLRTKLYNKFNNHGYSFQSVISNRSIISDFATLGIGVQIMPGAIIQAGAVIGNHSIINSGAIIEHDCIIGAHNHIAPGATLSGQVNTGAFVHIGTGANVIQGITIGDESIVGAGTVITKNIPSRQTIFGSSAKIKKQD
jgi:sugar O-acyltransferase (sialic acid O-acetyltransferase NeuD family)